MRMVHLNHRKYMLGEGKALALVEGDGDKQVLRFAQDDNI
jgi:hypothetical protein